VSLRLVPRKDGNGRVPASEVLINTAAVQENMRDLTKSLSIPDLIAQGSVQYGMQSFDKSLLYWYQQGIVSYESAIFYATNPSEFALKVRAWTRARASRSAAPRPRPGCAATSRLMFQEGADPRTAGDRPAGDPCVMSPRSPAAVVAPPNELALARVPTPETFSANSPRVRGVEDRALVADDPLLVPVEQRLVEALHAVLHRALRDEIGNAQRLGEIAHVLLHRRRIDQHFGRGHPTIAVFARHEPQRHDRLERRRQEVADLVVLMRRKNEMTRLIVWVASVVWSVENTRCPVSAAFSAVSSVSMSRIFADQDHVGRLAAGRGATPR